MLLPLSGSVQVWRFAWPVALLPTLCNANISWPGCLLSDLYNIFIHHTHSLHTYLGTYLPILLAYCLYLTVLGPLSLPKYLTRPTRHGRWIGAVGVCPPGLLCHRRFRRHRLRNPYCIVIRYGGC